ncbi:cell division protein FtsL [Microaerobacter geothermalis]|uniref:cell division protein FtsL n=1 Tax=Microaerobacter geothermalis TaxID=674972 RepID=UPI001F2C9E8B|nr:cell division protein FtsL [Microaerobacter geothermalis]MCF6093597.1 cell division protein FtsL [Microaerobacter geothermalis]
MNYYSHQGNLAVVQGKKRKSRAEKRRVTIIRSVPVGEKLLYLMMVILFVIVSGMVLSRYSQIAELNYQIQETKKQISAVNEEIANLQLKVAALNSPERILEIAEKKGMTQSTQVKIIGHP